MHMYVTSALQRTDMKAVGLQLALDLLHEKVPEKIIFSYFIKDGRFPNLIYVAFVHGSVGRGGNACISGDSHFCRR